MNVDPEVPKHLLRQWTVSVKFRPPTAGSTNKSLSNPTIATYSATGTLNASDPTPLSSIPHHCSAMWHTTLGDTPTIVTTLKPFPLNYSRRFIDSPSKLHLVDVQHIGKSPTSSHRNWTSHHCRSGVHTVRPAESSFCSTPVYRRRMGRGSRPLVGA